MGANHDFHWRNNNGVNKNHAGVVISCEEVKKNLAHKVIRLNFIIVWFEERIWSQNFIVLSWSTLIADCTNLGHSLLHGKPDVDDTYY